MTENHRTRGVRRDTRRGGQAPRSPAPRHQEPEDRRIERQLGHWAELGRGERHLAGQREHAGSGADAPAWVLQAEREAAELRRDRDLLNQLVSFPRGDGYLR